MAAQWRSPDRERAMVDDRQRLRKWIGRVLRVVAAGSATMIAGTALPDCADYGPTPVYGIPYYDSGNGACTTDDDCVQRFGQGWVCNTTSTPHTCRVPPDGGR
jgi:hypothetical protein